MTDDLLEFAQGLAREDKVSRLQGNMKVGMSFNPDAYSKAVQTAARTGVVPAAVLRDQQRFDQMLPFDPGEFVNVSPRTAEWLAQDVGNAAQAHDDLPSLLELEHASSGRPKGSTDSQWKAILEDRIRAAVGNRGKNEAFSSGTAIPLALANFLLSSAETIAWAGGAAGEVAKAATGGYASQSFDETARNVWDAIKNPAPEGSAYSTLKKWFDPLRAGWSKPIKQGPSQWLTDPGTGKAFENPDYSFWGRPALNTVESIPGTIAGFMLTGKAGPGMASATSARETYQAASAAGDDPISALAQAIVSGGANYTLMTKLPHPVTTSTVAGEAAQTIGRGVTLGLGMASIKNLMDNAAHGGAKPWFEGAIPEIASMVSFEAAGGIPRMFAAAEASRLKARSVEAYRDAATQILKNTTAESLLITPERLEVLYQDKNAPEGSRPDPVLVADQIAKTLGEQVAESYRTAIKSGTDVVLPTADVLARLDKDQHAALLPDLRLKAAEGIEAPADPAKVKELLADVPADSPDATEHGIVREELRRRFIAAGERPEVADDYALLNANFITNLARESRMRPTELLALRDPKIVAGEVPGSTLVAGGPNAADGQQGRGSGLDAGIGGPLGGGDAGLREPTGPGGPAVPRRNPLGATPLGIGPAPAEVALHGSKDANLAPNSLEVVKARTGSQLAQGVYLTDELGSPESGARKYASQAETGGSVHEIRHRISAPVDLGVEKVYSREEAAAVGITLPDIQDSIAGPTLWRLLERQHGSLEGARDFLLGHGYDSAYYIDKNGKRAWAIWDQSAVGQSRAIERNGAPVYEPWKEVMQHGEGQGQEGRQGLLGGQGGPGGSPDILLQPGLSNRDQIRAARKLDTSNLKAFTKELGEGKDFEFNGLKGKDAIKSLFELAKLKEMPGAPPTIRTDADRTALLDKFEEMAREGEAGRFWYDESAQAFLDAAGGDRLEALRIAALSALYSPQTGVPDNGRRAILAYYDAKHQMAISVGGVHPKVKTSAQAIMDAKTPEEVVKVFEGQKVNSFQQNLIDLFAPEHADPNKTTIDIWMMRAAGYDNESPSSTQYTWMEKMVQEVAAELGWKPKEAQAAIWIAQKAKTEGKSAKAASFHFGDAINKIAGQVNVESMPGSSVRSTVLPGIENATPSQLHAYHTEKMKIVEQALKDAGVLVSGHTLGHGYWEGETNPVTAFFIPVPHVGSEGDHQMGASAFEELKLAARIVADVVGDQDAIGVLKPFWSSKVGEANGVHFSLSRELTSGEMAVLGEEFYKLGLPAFIDAADPKNIKFVNYGFDGSDPKAAKAYHAQVAELMEKFTPDDVKLEKGTFAAFSDLIKGSGDGQDHQGSGDASERSSVVQRSIARWRQATEDLNTRTAEELRSSAEQRPTGTGQGEVGTLYQPGLAKTDTPEFKAWFGEGSTLVNGDGSPMVLYHGTDRSFTEFKASKTGAMGPGIYFGIAPEAAAGYAGDGKGSQMIPVYLRGKYLDNYQWSDYVKKHGWAGAKDAATQDGFSGVVDSKFEDAVVVWNSTDIKSALANRGTFDPTDPNILHQPGSSSPRGWFRVLPDGTYEIGKTKVGDLSTFIHEPAHAHFTLMGEMAARAEASDQLKADWESAKKFAAGPDGDGVADGVLTREGHERLANGAEAYFREGKAPTAGLRGVFERFAVWLGSIYRKATDLGVELDPEIRGVFDRMYAGERAVEEASKIVDTKPMFATPEQAGMTQAEFDLYTKAAGSAIQNAHATVMAKLNREHQREQQTWWRDAEASTRADVAKELDAEPVRVAAKSLAAGELEDGTPLKLNRQAVIDQFGEDALKALPHGLRDHKGQGTVDADTAAEILGFDSGSSLIRALTEMEPRKDAISRITSERMKAKYGDMVADGSINEAAIEAMHDKAREEMLTAELRVLRAKEREMAPAREFQRRIDEAKSESARAEAQAAWEAFKADQKAKAAENRGAARDTAEGIPSRETFVAAAKQIVDGSTVRDLSPYSYLLASRREGKKAFDLMGKDDYAGAAAAKQKELLNHHLFLEAVKAKEEAQGIRDYGAKGVKAPFQGMLGKAGVDFQEQWNTLASRYSFDSVPYIELDRQRKSLEAWAAAMVDEGAEIDPILFREGPPKNWREVPISELRAVRDGLKNIETVAKHQLEVTLNGKRIVFEEALAELESSARGRHESTPIPRGGTKFTAKERAANFLLGADAWATKMDHIIDHIGGTDINQPWRRFIKQVIDDANGNRKQMAHDVVEKLRAAAEARPKGDLARDKDSTDVQFPRFDRPLTRSQLITWVLNLGTVENRNVALLGERLVDEGGALRPEAEKALRSLSSADYQFIQSIWDALEGLRPAIADKEQRVTGLVPKWKENTPFTVTTSDGHQVRLRGGYFPLRADVAVSNIGVKQAEPVIGEGSYTVPTTSRSHTKEVTGATYPLLLDYQSILGRHLNNVITDVTMGEAISAVHKLVTNEGLRTTLKETIGPSLEGEMFPWLVAVSGRSTEDTSKIPLTNLLMQRRSGMVMARLAGNVTSYAIQVADILKPWTQLPAAEIGRAFYDIRRNPKEMIEWIREMSPNEMRFREQNFQRDIKDMLDSHGPMEGAKKVTGEWLMEGFGVMDRFSSFPAWLAAFRVGMKAHGIEEQAVREADRLIGETMQAGEARNMSRMMRSEGLIRLFTTFGGDANTWYGILSSSVRSKNPRAISVALMALVAEQMVTQTIKARWPQKDDEWGTWTIENALGALFNPLGPVGDVAKYLMDNATGKYARLSSPTLDAIEKPFALSRSAVAYKKGTKDLQELSIDVLDAVGIWAGIPGTGQAVKTWKYQHGISTGKQPTPRSEAEHAIHLVTGPPPKEH